MLVKEYSTVKEYANRVQQSEQWVRTLCRLGKINAQRFGRDWLIFGDGTEQRDTSLSDIAKA